MNRAATLQRIVFIYLFAFLIMSLSSAHAEGKKGADAKKPAAGKKTFAVIDTTKGKIKLLLRDDFAPKAVENFVGLADGTKEWTDKAGKKVKKPFYDGLNFHRVIPGFMIQGGDPMGTGSGGPGYKFNDEITDKLNHNKAGTLAMANSGPNTNGSQFYITTDPQPRLNGGYTVFGELVEGLDVVKAISNVERDSMDKPLKEVKINSVKITHE